MKIKNHQELLKMLISFDEIIDYSSTRAPVFSYIGLRFEGCKMKLFPMEFPSHLEHSSILQHLQNFNTEAFIVKLCECQAYKDK